METESMRARLSGIFVPIATPFAADEEVDYEALTSNLKRYAQSGIRGYLALGSNGENKSLTEEEKLRVLEAVVRHRRGDQVVLAGATYEAQRDTERFLRSASEVGADFGLVLAPSYFRKQMTEDVLLRYYATLAEASPIPVLVYNAPGFNGLALSPELVGRLSSVRGIVGMKDSGRTGIEHFLEHSSEEFLVLAGSAEFLFPAMLLGAPGGTVSLANAFPSLAGELFECGRTRDESRGRALQERVTRINRRISGTYGVPGVKAAMDLAGFKGGLPRRPLLPLTEEQRGELRQFLREEGLISDV